MTFPTGYTQYDQITIDKTKVGSGGVASMDVWLPLSRLSSTAQSTLRDDGGDARFTLDDGTTRIANDIIGKIESSNQALDSTGLVGKYTAIAVSGTNIFISYYDETNGNLKFIKSSDSGATWGTPQILDSTGVVGRYTSIAVNGANVFISYYDVANYDLKFIKSSDSGVTWGTPQRLDFTGVVGRYTSIAVSGTNVFISYNDSTNFDLKFIKSADSGVTWGTPRTIDSAIITGEHIYSIVSGTSVIVGFYRASNGAQASYIRSKDLGVTWGGVEALDTIAGTGQYTSIATDGANLFASYYNNGTTELRFAKKPIDIEGFRVNIPTISDVADTKIRLWYNGIDAALAATDAFGQYATYNGVSLYSPLGYNSTGTAPQMLDRTSNVNHGTVNGGVTNVTGQVGNGATFNGTSDYVSSSDSVSLNKGTGAYSLSCWMSTTAALDMTMFGKISSTSPYPGYGVLILSNGVIRLRAGDNLSGTGVPVEGTINVRDGLYHHIYAIRTATQLLLYVDGVLDNSVNLIATNSDNTTPFMIGQNSINNYYFNGKIDEVRVEVQRSASWIKTAYNNEKSPLIFFSNITAQTSGASTPLTIRSFPVIGSRIIQGAIG